MPHILNSTISNHRDPKASCILRYLENSSGLWPAHCHNLLSDAYGASSHANPQCIYSGIDQVLCLSRGYHITANHLQIWVTLFYEPRKSDLFKITIGSAFHIFFFFWPFRPQFGLKISGGGGVPREPPLDPPLYRSIIIMYVSKVQYISHQITKECIS